MRSHRRIWSLQAALLLAIPSAASAQKGETWPAVFREATEVRVINLDVVVTDRQGQPVRGLRSEDFQLLENGRPLEISNFYAVEGGRARTESEGPVEAALPADPRFHLILFCDNANLTAPHRGRALLDLRQQLSRVWSDDLRVMVASNDRFLSVVQDFTASPEELLGALDRLARRAARGGPLEMQRRDLLRQLTRYDPRLGRAQPGETGGGPNFLDFQSTVQATAGNLLPQMRLYNEEKSLRVSESLGILKQLVEILAGLPGRKALLYVGSGLPLRPGAALFHGYAREFELLPGTAVVSAELESARFDTALQVAELSQHANAAGVTFYPLDASLAVGGPRGAAETDSGFWSTDLASLDEHARQDSLTLLADGTGGSMARGVGALGRLLEEMRSDHENRYSLGFVAERLGPDELRELEVRVEGDNVQTRYRRSFRDKSPDDRSRERTLSALLIDRPLNPLAIELLPGAGRPQEDGTVLVPLEVKIPMGSLVLRPGGQVHRARTSIFVATRDRQGRTSEVVQRSCHFSIPNAEVMLAQGRIATCEIRLRMRAGPHRLAVSVRDDLARVDSTVRLQLDSWEPAAGMPQ